MTETFAERLAGGEQHESAFGAWLRDSQGWHAWKFGQALLPESSYEFLARWRDSYQRPTRIRWLPDLLGVNPRAGTVCLVDAKSETDDYPNYAIEVDALETGLALIEHLHTPVYYAFTGSAHDDFRVLTPRVVANRWHMRKNGSSARGSKTSFVCVAKEFAVPAFRVFIKAG